MINSQQQQQKPHRHRIVVCRPIVFTGRFCSPIIVRMRNGSAFEMTTFALITVPSCNSTPFFDENCCFSSSTKISKTKVSSKCSLHRFSSRALAVLPSSTMRRTPALVRISAPCALAASPNRYAAYYHTHAVQVFSTFPLDISKLDRTLPMPPLQTDQTPSESGRRHMLCTTVNATRTERKAERTNKQT